MTKANNVRNAILSPVPERKYFLAGIGRKNSSGRSLENVPWGGGGGGLKIAK